MKPRGALFACFTNVERTPGNSLRWSVESYAATAALCLGESRLLGMLLDAASRDALTGCASYARLREEFGREIRRSERHARPLACLFIDLDDFAAVNTERGHMWGNHALAAVGRALRDGMRDSDWVGRFGGDEFVIALPETGLTDARLLGNRLIAEIESATEMAIGDPVTASVGAAVWRPGESVDDLLEAADRDLLSTKRGRPGLRPAFEIERFTFCGHCGTRLASPDGEADIRGCECRPAMPVRGDTETAAAPAEPFLIVDSGGIVSGASPAVALLLSLPEMELVDLHVDDVLVRCDAVPAERLSAMTARVAQMPGAVERCVVMGTDPETPTLMGARIGGCYEPQGAVIVLIGLGAEHALG